MFLINISKNSPAVERKQAKTDLELRGRYRRLIENDEEFENTGEKENGSDWGIEFLGKF